MDHEQTGGAPRPQPAAPPDANPAAVTELIGVYHADGGPVGEAKYIIGKLLGTAHCALCDVTHSPVRRKPEWDRAIGRIGLPVTLLHLNELSPDVAAAVAEHGSPALFGRRGDGGLVLLLDADDLDALGGSVAQFEAAVRQVLPPPAAI